CHPRRRSPCSFFFRQATAYDVALGIPADPLFRSLRDGRRWRSPSFSIARPRRNGERRRAPTASISKESPAITGVVEMVIRRPIRSEERRVGKECREIWWLRRLKVKQS